VAALGWLVAREYRPAPEGENAAPSTVRLPPTSTFYALRAGPDQVGLSSVTTDTLVDGLRVTSRLDVDVPVPLVPRRILTTTEGRYDARLRLRGFTTTVSGETGQLSLVATAVSETELSVVVSGRGVTTPDTLELKVPAGLLLPDAVPLGLASRGELRPGAVTTLHVLDPLDLTIAPWEVHVGAESALVVADSALLDSASGAWLAAGLVSTSAWRVTWMERGLPVVAWIDREGGIIERATPLGLTYERQPFEIVNSGYARRRPRNIQAAPLEVSAPATAPERPGRLFLGPVDLRAAAPMLTTPWQVVAQGGLDTRIGAVRQRQATAPFPDSIPASDRRYPASGRIVVEARRIAGADTASHAKAVQQLATWISAAIVPGPPAFGGVQQALLRRRGDSSDRAELLVEMARALGIPARPVAGLLFGGGRFRYRAWAEVWLGAWQPVDPTLGQFPADPSHVRLLIHSTARPAAIVSLVGAVRPALANPTTVP
jgi:transglutaminase-like putative cysteine protease